MAIVSAILVIVADKAKPEYVWLSIVPIILFYFLDSYYLGLERGFRDRYNEFVRKLHEERASLEDVFIVCPAAGALTMLAARSMSVLALYLLQLRRDKTGAPSRARHGVRRSYLPERKSLVN